MNTPVDFDKIRKKRKRKYRLKNLLILVGIIAAIIIALLINDIMVKKNLPSNIGNAIGSIGGDGFPVQLPSGDIKNIEKIGDNLIVLKESNLYAYSKKGKLINNIQQMNEKSVVITNRDNFLLYDIGGRKASLYSPTAHLFTFELESNIIAADIGDSGQVAIVTSPPNFVAEINVYTSKNNIFYNKSYSERLVSGVSLSTKGKNMAVASIGTNGGILESEVAFYDLTTKEDATSSISISDSIIIWMDYIDENTLGVLTNEYYYLFDTRGTIISSYAFPENFKLEEYRIGLNSLVLLGKDSDTRQYIITTLSIDGSVLGTVADDRKPIDLDINDKNLYALFSEGVTEYSSSLVIQNQFYLEGIERISIIGERIYVITKSEIYILDKESSPNK